eukprot:TRINITY_DN55922_c0_g1_i1.p1 TRINITY_DN55922_c0_g1~~TRINITY_DN55922_c0_g1_i1.p1  ORF type:complete len:427 (+),score=144.42 TRINITY_DN55922_c0_g1_i1:85-1281(+)
MSRRSASVGPPAGGADADVKQSGDAQDWARNVRKYRYKSPNLSLFERLFLNSFWERVAALYPMWLAPNLVSLSGFGCIVAAAALSLTRSPDLRGELPGWGYACLAFLFFAYQTFDGSDGKQARRTGSGSPLGELVDHGIDAVTMPFIAWFSVDILAYGSSSPWPWAVILLGPAGFMLSNLVLLHKGTQHFGALDIMEMQTCMILSLLATAWMGPGIWRTEVLGYEFRDLFVVCGSILVVIACLNYTLELFGVYRSSGGAGTPGRSGWPGTGPRNAVWQVLVTAALQAAWWAALSWCARTEEFIALLVVVTLSQADTMDRILVMRVAGEEMARLPPGLAVALSFTATVMLAEPQYRAPAIAAVLLAGCAIHLQFYFSRAARIAAACKIHPFRVGAPLRE